MDDDRLDRDGGDAPAPRALRPGAISLVVGLVLLAGAVALLGPSAGPAALGVQLGYIALWVLGISATVTGIARLRSRSYESLPAPAPGAAGRRSRAWVCEIPLVEHRYDRIGASATAPPRWRCRRCGRVRYSPPRSAGETLEASQAQQLVVKRYDEL